ncbi:hydroxysqualene dehydroxylase [Microvirga sp. 2TAF3]|uniref:hydroxysqualene dehydroxylase n=1 Tax=Microvirga sp. 2TAF3 TaxID=3233014 RepID=UPI003F9DB040
MIGRTHIVGAGIAGLSAALSVTEQGGETLIYEAAPQAGGRCRTIHPGDGFEHDNGTHVIFSANRRTLALLKTVGARDRWIEPEPEGIPIHDARTGRTRQVGLSPWSWLDPAYRPDGLAVSDLASILRLAFSSSDRPVGAVIGQRQIMESLIEPLTIAVLNTPVTEASSLRLGQALRRFLRPGASRLLVAGQGLSEDMVEPALRVLRSRGATLLKGQRLRSILTNGERVIGLALTDHTVALRAGDQVVLALPPWEVERLLPGLAVPQRFEPILNVHFRMSGPNHPRFIGFTGTLAQWALIRASHVSVTVSAAQTAIGRDTEDLAGQIWREIVPGLQDLGLAATASRQPESRIVKEKRATIRQAAGLLPQPPIRPLDNLALAGDWLGTLPATIESAVTAGERAISILHHARPGCPFVALENLRKTEGAT